MALNALKAMYVLELEHGKFLVGLSSDPIKAMEEHREGLGGAWTEIHRPVRIRETVPFVKEEELDGHVRIAMRKWGVENVRGGSWSGVRLTDQERQAVSGGNYGCVVC